MLVHTFGIGRAALRGLLFATVVALPLSACAPVINPISVISTVMDVASYTATGKSTTDHVISGVTEKDCALLRGVKGDKVCKEDPDHASEGLLDEAAIEPAKKATARN